MDFTSKNPSTSSHSKGEEGKSKNYEIGQTVLYNKGFTPQRQKASPELYSTWEEDGYFHNSSPSHRPSAFLSHTRWKIKNLRKVVNVTVQGHRLIKKEI